LFLQIFRGHHCSQDAPKVRPQWGEGDQAALCGRWNRSHQLPCSQGKHVPYFHTGDPKTIPTKHLNFKLLWLKQACFGTVNMDSNLCRVKLPITHLLHKIILFVLCKLAGFFLKIYQINCLESVQSTAVGKKFWFFTSSWGGK